MPSNYWQIGKTSKCLSRKPKDFSLMKRYKKNSVKEQITIRLYELDQEAQVVSNRSTSI